MLLQHILSIVGILLTLAVFISLKRTRKRIMSAIADFAAKQAAFNTELTSDLSDISTAIGALNDKITALQNSAGTVTPEDQALIDQMQTDGAALVTKADALAGKAPPTPPAA